MEKALSTPLAATVKDARRRQELKRAQSDLWYVAGKLGYYWNPRAGKGAFRGKGLTERLHKPICKWIDRRRDEHFTFLTLGRWHHKTTLAICEIVQDILRDPDIALFYFHSVEDEAEKVLEEVANHIRHNEWLRSLDPIGRMPDGTPYRAFPNIQNKRWCKTDRFTIYRPPELYSRFPTLLAKGAQSEITGAHANKAYLDDIITGKTVRENQLSVVASWVQNTVIPVVDDMVLRVSGTPWSDWGLYEDWRSDPEWWCCTIPGSVVEPLSSIDWSSKKIELTIDKTLANPVYGPESDHARQTKKLRILERQMKQDFAPQILCDRSPETEKPWSQSECEHFISLKDASGPGTIFVLGDPAPAKVGSVDGRGERARKDGTKDEWAIAVVKVRARGNRLERILLDGEASRSWTKDEGFERTAVLGKFWHTPWMDNESLGQAIALYKEDMRKAARRVGAQYSPLVWYDSDGKKREGLCWTYQGKNQYFGAMASAAKLDEVLIVDPETVPVERRGPYKRFLYGDAEDLGALQQARGWRPLKDGHSGLRYDDRANVWSFCMDPALAHLAPWPSDDWGVSPDEQPEWMREEVANEQGRTRYQAY